ncbi:hypothetical protein NHX12_007525 [Muraenolepis orangiensis]|uniref:Coiled-coil domain-containing protein 148 n=1 Tax=Muraenolepis orangiensis TaxID=630683 RepID=A0A9Q0DRS4_9TELE|nr:hypothetical protein NHX12_007525 [Muraenolepis orangiensis]
MSGRDLRAFITTCRTQDVGGKHPVWTRDAEYQRLDAAFDAKRKESDAVAQKVQKTLLAAKTSKEASLLRQHRQVWSREHLRLGRADPLLSPLLSPPTLLSHPRSPSCRRQEVTWKGFWGCSSRPMSFEITTGPMSFEITGERELFKMAIVEPILQLKDDLRFRMEDLIDRTLGPSEVLEIQHQETRVGETKLGETKLGETRVGETRMGETRMGETGVGGTRMGETRVGETSIGETRVGETRMGDMGVNYVKEQQEVVTGRLHAELLVLEEEIAALVLEDRMLCVSEEDEDLETVPAEILEADCPYPELKLSLVQSFEALTERYRVRRRSLRERLGGIDRQYGPDLPQRRTLCWDMVLRLLPHRSHRELVGTSGHETEGPDCVPLPGTLDHERVWDWQRFSQAQLGALVQGWQRDRGELLSRALVTLEEAQRDHQEELDLQRERRFQLDTCSRLRDQVQQWWAQQEEVSQLEAAMAARRQAEEEERLDRRRDNEASIRSQQRDKLKEFHSRQQERRKVRMQVAVVAEADPERMMGQTEAWRSRQQKDEALKPLLCRTRGCGWSRPSARRVSTRPATPATSSLRSGPPDRLAETPSRPASRQDPPLDLKWNDRTNT